MKNPVECSECQAILEELRAARREIVVSPERAAEIKAYADATRRMMTGTDEDVEELLAKFPFRSERPDQLTMPEHGPSDPRIRAVAVKMLRHQTRTGHKIADLFRK
jgi:hypothetical protein